MEPRAGTLLGGRVVHAQPAQGFRSGLEPVLLAASIPARAGDAVLEAGSGAGAGLLCLAARVPGINGEGWERDPELAALAAANAAASGLAGLRFVAGDILAVSGPPRFAHAFANPPYHRADGTASPNPARAVAKVAEDGLFAAWTMAMTRVLRPRGTLTVSVPAAVVPACLAAFAAAKCGSICLLPLWPREGRDAKLVLLRARREGRGPFRVLPGLQLHDARGLTARAEEVLRHAQALDF